MLSGGDVSQRREVAVGQAEVQPALLAVHVGRRQLGSRAHGPESESS